MSRFDNLFLLVAYDLGEFRQQFAEQVRYSTEADFNALQLDAQIKAPFGEKVAVRVLGLAVEHFVANDEAGGILDVAIAA